MNETCTTLEPLLPAFTDGELSARDRDAVQDHLDHCADCAREIRLLDETMDLVRRYISEPGRARPLAMPAPSALRRTRRFFRWGLAACLALAVGAVALLNASHTECHADAAMAEVARKLADIRDLSAAFHKEFAYSTATEGGYDRIKVSGRIWLQLKPEPKIKAEEHWRYFAPDGAEIKGLADDHTWLRARGVTEDRHGSPKDDNGVAASIGGSTSTGEYTTEAAAEDDAAAENNANDAAEKDDGMRELLKGGLFESCDGEALLPPAPQQEVYELARMIRGLSEDGYLKWFGKEWISEKTAVLKGETRKLTFVADAAGQAWRLQVELGPGEAIKLSLSMNLTDSLGQVLGVNESRFELTALNEGLPATIFEGVEEAVESK